MCFCQNIFLLSLDICSSFSYPHGQDNYLSCCSITDISYLYLFTLDISPFALEYIYSLVYPLYSDVSPVLSLPSLCPPCYLPHFLTCLSIMCSLIRIKLISPENNAYLSQLRTTVLLSRPPMYAYTVF